MTLNDEALKIILQQKRTCLSSISMDLSIENIAGKCVCCKNAAKLQFFAALLQQAMTDHHDVVEMAAHYINREFLSRCGFAKQKV